MGLYFLYDLGYDYASIHVHPISDDGESDFRHLTLPTQSGPLPDATVVRNSRLAWALLTQLALSVSPSLWRKDAVDLLDHIIAFLKGDPIEHQMTSVKIANAGPAFSLSRSSES
jgi:hypothetical protein